MQIEKQDVEWLISIIIQILIPVATEIYTKKKGSNPNPTKEKD